MENFKQALKRTTAVLMIAILLIGVAPLGSLADVDWPELALKVDASNFTPRKNAPSRTEYYSHSSSLNPFPVNTNAASGNCTWYAWGRAYEILRTRPKLSTGNADEWYPYNKSNGYYPYGSTPKLGAIACWGKGSTSGKHVAVVEEIYADGSFLISESSWSATTWWFRTKKIGANCYYSSSMTFQGFIYIIDGGTTFTGWDFEQPSTYPSYNGVLQNGSSDDMDRRVSFIQTCLNYLGYNCGTVDGKFGSNTENAVKSFQQKYNLSADGKIDQESWNKLIQEVTNAKTASKYANLGEDFYAVILNKAYWKPISQVENSDFVTLVTETGDPRQVWRFQRQPDGAYSIKSCYDGKALEMHNGNGAAIGTPISAWDDYWGGFYQQWYIVPQSGGCVLLSKHYTDKNRVMELKSNNSADGTTIQINERNNSDAQIWSIYNFDEVQLKPTTLSVNVNSPKVTFTWPDVYGAKEYNLRISNKNNASKTYLDLWKINSGVSLDLPAGTYQAYIDAANYFTWKQSNIVTFTVSNVAYSVTYDGNGGANIPAKQTKNSCVTLILSTTAPTKKGYKFVNWNSKKDGKGVSYGPGSNYTVNSNVTLYAQWQAEKYTVSFNTNGGTCSTNSKVVTYNNSYGSLPTPKKEGYKFVGWYTSASGGERIDSSTKVSTNYNHTLFARWSCLHNNYTACTTKKATCTTAGIRTYTCSCGDSYTEIIKATGKHTGGTATCKAKAKCSVCGTEYGSLANHKETTLAAKSATYTSTGLTAGQKCSVCGKITVAQKTVAKLTLGKVSGLNAKKVKVAKSSEITLAWNKVTGAKSYEVYQKSGSKWKKIKTTSSTSYTVKNLKADKEYQFKVRAVVDGANGAYSSVLKVETIPETTSLKLKAGKKQLTASWSKVSDISGYEIQYSTSKNFTKKTTKTASAKKSAKSTTIKKLTKGKKYYVRIRTYKTVNGKKIYSDWSAVKNVKVK